MANPTDFLLNTDYEMDKIVYFKEGEFTGEDIFDHNLNFTPLLFGVWSTDNDFSNSNTIGSTSVSYEPGATNPLGVYAISYDYNKHIKIRTVGDGRTTTKIYYRLYAFEPPNSKSSSPHTSSAAKQFILNTDYNYRKLKASGTFTQIGEEYYHNLGYIPHVVAWAKFQTDDGGEIEPFSWGSLFTGIYMTITPEKIKFSPDVSIYSRDFEIYWRIYYDET